MISIISIIFMLVGAAVGFLVGYCIAYDKEEK